jgi:non-ribosomal peptide synthetase component F
VCVPRGPDEPISMLAVWAAGGAYVPLDPSHPSERIRVILEDARPQVLITHEAVAKSLDIPDNVRVLWLDQEEESLRTRRPMALCAAQNPEQLAYILFTSGSTGRPKGVGVPRRAIANFLRSMAHTPGLSETDRLLSVTTITFDIAGLELFLPLWVGATVYVADRETALDAHKLRAALERDAITVMQATPTTWRLLLETGFGAEGTELCMLCGGEAMS